MSVFLTFLNKKMAFLSFPYGWPWDASPPPPESVRTYGRTLVRWRHNQIFSSWWITNFSYPWCFAGALRALKLAKIIACKFHWRQYNTAWFHLSSVTKCIAKLFFRSAAAGRFKTFLHLQSRFLLCLGLQYSNIAMKSLLLNESSTNAFLEYTVLMEQSQWLRFYGTLVIFVSLGVLRLSLTLLNPLKAALNSKTVSGCLKFIHSRVSESWDKWPNKSAWTSPPS